MKLKDLTGQRFGRLTVLERGPNLGRHVQWRCHCDCGQEHLATSSNLVQGFSRSCGCYHLDRVTTHNETGSLEYSAWTAMKARCYTISNIGYPFYGGRGIVVCERWKESFATFLSDMGRKPSPDHSLDRIDPSGNYSPENCRWAPRSVQDNNRRDNRRLTFAGKTQTIAQWAREKGLKKGALISRLKWGWPIEDALSMPSERSRVNPRHVKPR